MQVQLSLTHTYIHTHTHAHAPAAGSGNSPQGADEAIDGALGVQRHDVPDMEEAGGRVRHPAAGSETPAAAESAGTPGRNFLPSTRCSESHAKAGRFSHAAGLEARKPGLQHVRTVPGAPTGARPRLFLAALQPGVFSDMDALPSHCRVQGASVRVLRVIVCACGCACVDVRGHGDRLRRFKKKKEKKEKETRKSVKV